MKKIEVLVEKTDTGFSAGAENYPVYTAGDDLTEIRKNIVEALNLYFEDKGKTISQDEIELVLDISSFFHYYKVLNAKALSDRIGMNQSLLAQYIKGIKKPSPSQSQRILKGVQQLGRELAEIRFIL